MNHKRHSHRYQQRLAANWFQASDAAWAAFQCWRQNPNEMTLRKSNDAADARFYAHACFEIIRCRSA